VYPPPPPFPRDHAPPPPPSPGLSSTVSAPTRARVVSRGGRSCAFCNRTCKKSLINPPPPRPPHPRRLWGRVGGGGGGGDEPSVAECFLLRDG